MFVARLALSTRLRLLGILARLTWFTKAALDVITLAVIAKRTQFSTPT
tara:strand:+ start:3657 stop:3800 length:144 start_codon:yes stop_codon:yes gene_type:complete